MTTLHFEIESEDALRKVGMSKERRVDPQVTVGLLTDRPGFPLDAHLFEGNKAETNGAWRRRAATWVHRARASARGS